MPHDSIKAVLPAFPANLIYIVVQLTLDKEEGSLIYLDRASGRTYFHYQLFTRYLESRRNFLRYFPRDVNREATVFTDESSEPVSTTWRRHLHSIIGPFRISTM